MKNILDYRMVILANDGKIIEYPIEPSFMHRDCLDSFAHEYGYDYSNMEDLTKKGNVIFSNCGNKILGVCMPEHLNGQQLYMLDYLENWLEEVEVLDVRKQVGEKFEAFLFVGNIRKHFSEEIIQLYYSSDKTKKK